MIELAGPYTMTKALLKIDGNTIDVVEGATVELEIAGGIEHYFGSRTGKHAVGGKRATFSARRWYMASTDTDLFYDLFNDELPFSLSGEIDGVSNSQVTLSDCRIYRWRPVMGGANDLMAEEISGEALSWTATIA